jgi:hypothetical protein
MLLHAVTPTALAGPLQLAQSTGYILAFLSVEQAFPSRDIDTDLYRSEEEWALIHACSSND